VITRRALLGGLVLGIATAPLVAEAQQAKKVSRIGYLIPNSPSTNPARTEAFRQGLRELGYVEGRNIVIEYRYAEGKLDRLPALAAELVRLRVDVIVTAGPLPTRAAKEATTTIPIVMAQDADPVGTGSVASLPRPGGNVTGLSQMGTELTGKRLELLKEMVPKLSRVAVLWNPGGAGSTLNWKELQLPARQLGIQLHSLEVRGPDDFEKAFEEATRARAGALFIIGNPVIAPNLKRIADFAAKSRLPSIFQSSTFADVGGLVTYGPDIADSFRRAATFVDKILKGAKPGDLPIEQPTKLELVINLKTAKVLGITIPQSVRLRADRVIE